MLMGHVLEGSTLYDNPGHVIWHRCHCFTGSPMHTEIHSFGIFQ